jgi:hypothetical protein
VPQPEAFTIRCPERLGEREIAGLSEVLIDCVAGGASVSFLLPMPRSKAEGCWRTAAASVAHGELRVLMAEDAAGRVIGTVQLALDQPENQPHRADLAKMLAWQDPCAAQAARRRNRPSLTAKAAMLTPAGRRESSGPECLATQWWRGASGELRRSRVTNVTG